MPREVVAIYIGPTPKGPMSEVHSVEAVAGKGLEGDRYFTTKDKTEEITLVDREGVEAAASESGIDITLADTRRNIVTTGVDLTSLIGKTFHVGPVTIEALEDNPPCRRLQSITGKKLIKPLMGRAGIRGRIVTSGTITVGDSLALPE
jgi:MOSC domain-containing protein YiiM